MVEENFEFQIHQISRIHDSNYHFSRFHERFFPVSRCTNRIVFTISRTKFFFFTISRTTFFLFHDARTTYGGAPMKRMLSTFITNSLPLTRAVPKHNVLVIGGDMNAQLGKTETHKHAFHDNTNRNRNHLSAFIEENELLCLSTKFQNIKSKLFGT